MKKRIFLNLLILFLLFIALFFILNHLQEPNHLTQQVKEKVGGQYIKLSKGEVHYELLGKEGPLIVLVGGAGLGYSVWDNNIKTLLANGFRVLRYDHYGRGYSDKIDGPYTFDLFHSQFAELIDSLHLSENFYLAGLSMGAMVAVKYTNENPGKVIKLILIDPAGINPFRAPFILKTPVISDLALTFYWRPKAVKSQMEEFYEPQKFKEYRRELQKQIQLKGYKKVQQSIWLNTLNVDMSEEVEKLGKSRKEVLLIWGKQDPRTLIETSSFFIKAIPKVQFLSVEKAGHLSNYERPEVINPRIIRFLKH